MRRRCVTQAPHEQISGDPRRDRDGHERRLHVERRVPVRDDHRAEQIHPEQRADDHRLRGTRTLAEDSEYGPANSEKNVNTHSSAVSDSTAAAWPQGQRARARRGDARSGPNTTSAMPAPRMRWLATAAHRCPSRCRTNAVCHAASKVPPKAKRSRRTSRIRNQRGSHSSTGARVDEREVAVHKMTATAAKPELGREAPDVQNELGMP